MIGSDMMGNFLNWNEMKLKGLLIRLVFPFHQIYYVLEIYKINMPNLRCPYHHLWDTILL